MKILSFVDGSIYAESVCSMTAWAAKRMAADVDVYHILGRRDAGTDQANLSGNIGLGARSALLEELAELDAQKAKLAHKHGRAILEDAVAIIMKNHDGAVQSYMRHGDVLETLKKFEAEADLLIIGKRGEAADFAKLHLGSNVERVARSTTKSLLISSRAFWPVEKFVIAFDGSHQSQMVVDKVARSKLLVGLDCHIVFAGAASGAMTQKLADAVTMLEVAGYKTTQEIINDEPEDALPKVIEQGGYKLLVMGAYGHSRIRAMIIGSTTSEMIRSCKVPVLMVR